MISCSSTIVCFSTERESDQGLRTANYIYIYMYILAWNGDGNYGMTSEDWERTYNNEEIAMHPHANKLSSCTIIFPPKLHNAEWKVPLQSLLMGTP